MKKSCLATNSYKDNDSLLYINDKLFTVIENIHAVHGKDKKHPSDPLIHV